MPCWYFDPSEIQSSSLDLIHQKQGVALIILISDLLKIPYEIYETAVVYLHRTYISYSYSKLHRHVVALTCLNLSCKYLDANIKLEDIIKSARTILTDIQYEALGTDIMAEVTLTEKLVLCALKYDLEIDHAYPYVIKMAKLIKGDPATIEKLVYMTWTFINDSLYSTLSVQYEPDILAVSLFYLSCRLAHFELTEWEGMPTDILPTKKWYELFVPGVNVKLIQDICHKVLQLYKNDESEYEDDDDDIDDDDGDMSEDALPKTSGNQNDNYWDLQDRKKESGRVSSKKRPHSLLTSSISTSPNDYKCSLSSKKSKNKDEKKLSSHNRKLKPRHHSKNKTSKHDNGKNDHLTSEEVKSTIGEILPLNRYAVQPERVFQPIKLDSPYLQPKIYRPLSDRAISAMRSLLKRTPSKQYPIPMPYEIAYSFNSYSNIY